VIEQAGRQAAAWQELRPDAAPLGVAVNVSARQLADPELSSHIEGVIRAHRIEPASLWLELTETALLDDTAFMEHSLKQLKGLGLQLILDDFGVGFSSLGYLKRLPLSMIKLDRSFVENVTDSPHDAAIVRAVSQMADSIGIGVVAEGVETQDQVRMARDLGCGYAQGFHFARPVPASEVGDLLERPMPAIS
jgi:EAL domain-containing protein (putative c-di-GMP-specific phosphodiesterase class I)